MEETQQCQWDWLYLMVSKVGCHVVMGGVCVHVCMLTMHNIIIMMVYTVPSIFQENIPYSLKFSRDKYFVVQPKSAQKQLFTDKIFMIELPATPCICYKLEISWEKFFAAALRPVKSVKIFNLENFRLYGSALVQSLGYPGRYGLGAWHHYFTHAHMMQYCVEGEFVEE